jgi:3-hydroxyisobutyrate dehydrogenase
MQYTPTNTTIGFIGTGVMGKSMAGHLLKAGYPLHVYTRTRARAQDLLDAGATWQQTPADMARACNAIITIVGFPADVESVYLGPDGLVRNACRGSHLVDMTTSSPQLAGRIFKEAEARGLHALDAPVSGGDVGAQEARLSIMVGGERAAFDAMLPVFEKMGTSIVYQGSAGSGQHTKMANQIAIACSVMGVCEALAYAKKAGLNPQSVLESVSSGSAASWQLSNMGPRMLAGNFAPGFYVKHFIKDLGIALSSATEMKLDTPGLSLAKSLFERLAAQGGADDGTQALFRLYDR